MSGLPEDCHFLIFDRLTTEEKLLARGVCQEWRSVIEDLLSKQTTLSTRLPNAVRKGLFWSPCSVNGHKRSHLDTIDSKWKANDLQNLVAKYFRGVKALFVYNVVFCSEDDLIHFMDMLRVLKNLEHLEFAFCSYRNPNFATSSNSHVNMPKLAHFAAISNFTGNHQDSLLKFLMTKFECTNLTTIRIDTCVALACPDDMQAMIASNLIEDFQIVEGPNISAVRNIPRQDPFGNFGIVYRVVDADHVTLISDFHQMINDVTKIAKLSRLDNCTNFPANDSVKELSLNTLAKIDQYKGLVAINWINRINAYGIYTVSGQYAGMWFDIHGGIQQASFSSLISPDVLPNLSKLRIGLISISIENLQFICHKLTNLEHLAIGSLDGLLEDGEGQVQMDVNIKLNSEMVQISNLDKLTHLELNFTGIADDNLIILLDELKNLHSISLIGCYQLRAVDSIFEGRKLTVIRESIFLKHIQLMTKEEINDQLMRTKLIHHDQRPKGFLNEKRCKEILEAEVIRLTTDPPPHWSIGVESSDQLTWNATLIGPEDSIYSEIMFSATIKFSKLYPNEALQVMFTSDIFHPNIIRNKNVELDILKKSEWTREMNVEKVLNEISKLLVKPALIVDKVINHEAAHLFENAKRKFNHKTRQLFKFSY